MSKKCISCGCELQDDEKEEGNICFDCKNIMLLEKASGNKVIVVDSEEEMVKAIEKLSKDKQVFIDTSFCGNNIKAKFFRIVNKNRRLYAKLEVIEPKEVSYKNKVIDLTKITTFSNEEEFGIFVGNSDERNKDSLYVENNAEKTFKNGHIGYFKLFNTLLSEQSDVVRKILGVDNDFDGEW